MAGNPVGIGPRESGVDGAAAPGEQLERGPLPLGGVGAIGDQHAAPGEADHALVELNQRQDGRGIRRLQEVDDLLDALDQQWMAGPGVGIHERPSLGAAGVRPSA